MSALIIVMFVIAFSPSLINAQIHDTPAEMLNRHKQKIFKDFRNQPKHVPILQSRVDALYYKLQLEIRFAPNLLTGKVTNRYSSRINGLENLEIDLDDAMQISHISGPVSGFTHSNQKVLLQLSQVFNQDDTIEIMIEYSGVPETGDDSWFVFDKTPDGSEHVWTLSEPYGAKYWWPCKDTPADKADSVDIIVTVPSDQIVASNGLLYSEKMDSLGRKIFHWKETYQIATYLVSLAIAPYFHFTDEYVAISGEKMLLDYYVYPGFENEAPDIFSMVHDHLNALTHYFGPYPFIKEKYGMAQFRWGGAMEHQTLTSITRVQHNWDYVYVHELGHQWFGDALTCASWSDIWLNEGFASYSEALYAEWSGYNDLPPGKDAYRSYITNQAFFEDGTVIVEDTTIVANIFDRVVYDKGSWVLHMLRGILGDEDFFDALYNYANGSFKYRSVKTEDFIAVCEQISGKSLAGFFDQWLNYEYFPVYTYQWERDPKSNEAIRVTINQNQNSIIYQMPVDLQFIFISGKDTVVTVENNLREQEYMFILDDVPVQLNFDPENWILKTANDLSGGIYSDDVRIQSIYPNPAKNSNTIIVKYWDSRDLTLKIYDVNGKEIINLKPYYKSALHEYFFKWNAISDNGKKVSSGLYFVQAVIANEFTGEIRKVVIIK